MAQPRRDATNHKRSTTSSGGRRQQPPAAGPRHSCGKSAVSSARSAPISVPAFPIKIPSASQGESPLSAAPLMPTVIGR